MTFSKKLRLCLTAIFGASVIIGCENTASNNAPEIATLKGGVLNLTILPQSFRLYDYDCGLDPDAKEEVGDFICIAAPIQSEIDEEQNWDWDYVRALETDGWAFAGGAANVYYLEKPIDENCSHKLYMVGWFQGTPEQIDKYETDGTLEGVKNKTFAFAIDHEPVCGDERDANK